MNPSDVISAVTHGMVWLAAGGAAYMSSVLFLLTIGEGIHGIFSQRITTVPELQDIVEKEAKKLGITKTLIATLCYGNSMCRKTPDGTYKIYVQGDDATHAVVRHELYHLYKGDCEWEGPEKFQWDLWYFLVAEPRAVIYEIFRIKL